MTLDPIIAKIEASRRELLDLGLRNPLISYRTLRAKGVEATDANPVTVFDVLVRGGRTLSFLPRPDEDEPGQKEQAVFERSLFLSRPDEEEPGTSARTHSDNRIQTQVSSQELQRRLLNTYHTSNTLIQEQGVNTLFIALGMVRWYETEASDRERRAPLVLVPVSLERTSVRAGFRVKYTSEELGANVSFMEKARTDFGIDLPALHEKSEEDDEEIDVEAYFRKVKCRIRRQKRWTVDASSVVLSFFSFSKLLMYQDLDLESWSPGSGPLESNILRALFGDGFSEPEPAIGDDDHLDAHLRPTDVHHVVDADSSQALAIHDVSNDRNLVVQGPPGTGKSQTITNIIAEAISQNKKVLFVSEKMAALEVVKRRLDQLHLGEACLELHSHKTTKRAVLDELKRTWELGRPNVEWTKDDFASLSRVRDGLNQYVEAVNTPVDNTGVRPFDAYGEIMQMQEYQVAGSSNLLPRPQIDGIDSWSRPDFERKNSVVSDLQNNLKPIGVLKNHIFWGCRLRVALPSEVDSLRESVSTALQSLGALQDAIQSLCTTIRLSAPADTAHIEKLLSTAEHVVHAPSINAINLGASEWKIRADDLGMLRDSGTRWSGLRAEFDSKLKPAAWGADVTDIRDSISKKGLLPTFLRRGHRRANKQLSMLCRTALPDDAEGRIALIDAILEESRLREMIAHLSPVARVALGRLWRGADTDWTYAGPVIDWTLNLYSGIDTGKFDSRIVDSLCHHTLDPKGILGQLTQCRTSLDSYLDCSQALQESLEMDIEKRFQNRDGLAGLPLEEQEHILDEWSSGMEGIQDIVAVNRAIADAEKEGLHAVTRLAEEWPDASDRLVDCFEKARYERIVSRAFDERPALKEFNRIRHEAHIERFCEMDRRALDQNRDRVALVHYKGLPQRGETGQLGVLRREFEKKRRHLPIRQLIMQAGKAVQAIKPVFMMSPLSIATYIAPDSVKFDLVVFDEASQVKPVDALGAFMRAGKAVVVGDDQQLPPTSFFDSVIHTDDDDADDSVTADIESILGLMRTEGCPSRMLRWHYRSRHESLIAVSNQEFYENRLVVFPSPDSSKSDVGLRYHHIADSTYDRGGSRTNRKEAQKVATAVMQHARQSPNLTLGVAAFSSAQMQAIVDELEMLRKQDTSFESFFNAHPEEPFFVKNLENVQGDERDVIFISVGYGRDANGKVTMNFGPVNREGGERRLNVIITRARRRCHVFTNLRADDINLGNNRSIGLRAFKTFLAYAESGILPSDMPIASGRDMDSPFQREVVSRLRSMGYEAHEEVASGGKFVDIAIVDPERPGRYILGIECDGAAYHSSRSARDRDRIREQVLKGLGWRLHRIWSTDWFMNPNRELERAAEAIEQTKATSDPDRPAEREARREIQRTDSEEATSELAVQQYKLAEPVLPIGSHELHEVPPSLLVKPIGGIVRVEGPVHVSEVRRRIAEAVGIKRIGAKIKANLDSAILYAARQDKVVRRGDFLWVRGMRRPAVRSRDALPPSQKKIELVSPEEVAEAVKIIVKRSYRIGRTEAAAEAGRLLGFKSVSSNIRAQIDRVIETLIGNGDLRADGDQIEAAA